MACLVGCKNQKTNGGDGGETNAPVYSFALNKSELELEVGETFELVAVHGDETIVYESSTPAVATVSEKGVVTAVAEGVSYIKVSAGKQELSCKITVYNPTYTIEMSETECLVLVNGATKMFTAILYKDGVEYKSALEWSVSNAQECILEVDGNYATFTSETSGLYTVTVSSGKATASCEIKVMDKNATRLEAPTLTRSDNVVSWTAVSNATVYYVRIDNGAWVQTTQTSYTVADGERVYVFASVGEACTFFDSDVAEIAVS